MSFRCIVCLAFGFFEISNSYFDFLEGNLPFYIVSSDDNTDWYTANMTCNEWYGTYVASIDNREQNDLVYELIDKTDNNNLWIGWHKNKSS